MGPCTLSLLFSVALTSSRPCPPTTRRVLRRYKAKIFPMKKDVVKPDNHSERDLPDYSSDWQLPEASASSAEIEARFYYEFARESQTILRLTENCATLPEERCIVLGNGRSVTRHIRWVVCMNAARVLPMHSCRESTCGKSVGIN